MTEADPQFETEKAALREKALARRAGVRQAERAEAAQAAANHFLQGVPLEAGKTVALYWPIRDEIDCRPILAKLMDSGQPVCLPAVVGEAVPLELRLWEPGEALYPSGFGTLAPSEIAPRAVPDILVIPLLAFDRKGTRLGYGKGHYDRTVAQMRITPLLVGYAFAAQELDFIPRAPHDIPLDLVVTEAGVTRFAANEAA